ncbi:MAG TPA: maleylpyruvate isomerase family mycothiol-dependent enzyme [Amycolatopsis sp.]|nr:maleylpyruvate isomerase family mycothiol-dependent enzyme [Amycolatopsis sp.]
MTELKQRLAWLDEGSRVFFDHLEQLPDSAFTDPGTLPGWTNAHLVAHVGYNARGLSRLVHWAKTGEETRMYESPEARDEEIEDGSHLSPTELRTLAFDADQKLRVELTEVTDWDAEVRPRLGRSVPASEIPWMRVRELWIHGVDLGTGLDFTDFPADLVDTLITDIAGIRDSAGQGPALVLRPDDRDREWRIGSDGRVVRGKAADLARWLAGRGTVDGPDLGRWL